jgi:hypothetical protein
MHVEINARHPLEDQITQPLFDSTLIDGGPYDHRFFCTPLGQRDVWHREGQAKIAEDTNMYAAAQLVAGNSMYVTQIGVYFVPNSKGRFSSWKADAEDTLKVLGCGMLTFEVMDRRYLQLAPLAALPPGFPMYWAHDEAALSKLLVPTVIEGEKVDKFPDAPHFKITPIYIASQQSFSVRVHTEERFTLNSRGKLGVILYGQLIREYQ